MNNLLTSTAIVGVLAAAPAFADPTAMLGLSWSFGGTQSGQLGISARILSSDRRDEFVAAIGGTYYPGSETFGLDVGVGYNWEKQTFTFTYDVLNQGWGAALGWADLGEPEDISYDR